MGITRILGRPCVVRDWAYPEWAGRQGVVEKTLLGTNPYASGPWLACSMLPYSDDPAEVLVFHLKEIELL